MRYYKYEEGKNNNDIVKLTAKEIAEYLDNNLEIQQENLDVFDKTTVEDYLKPDNKVLYAYVPGQTSEAIDNLQTGDGGKEQFVSGINKIIKLHTDELSPLADDPSSPKSQAFTITGTRLLATTVSELSVEENKTEIVKVEQTGGSPIALVPGNYVPEDGDPLTLTHELDSSASGRVIITPPTGLEFDYMSYVIIAIVGLGVLGVGIILIRKFIIKK